MPHRPDAQGPTFVKICGITRLGDAREAVRAGANAIGFVFAPSPRRVSPARARAISSRVHPAVRRIGVFVDEEPARILAVVADARLDGVQLHGSEPVEVVRAIRAAAPGLFLLKVIRLGGSQPLAMAVQLRAEALADAVMVDTKDPADLAATPVAISAQGLAEFDGRRRPDQSDGADRSNQSRSAGVVDRLVLAGGLTPGNVGALVRQMRPWGVDVSSGVESAPGRKDAHRIRAFVRAVREAEGS
jgi:phosphoribosylanthranilate isomerase